MRHLWQSLIDSVVGNWKAVLLAAVLIYLVVLVLVKRRDINARSSYFGLEPDALPREVQRVMRRNDRWEACAEAFGAWLRSLAILLAALLLVYVPYALYKHLGWGWAVTFVALLGFLAFGVHAYFVGEGDAVIPVIVTALLAGVAALLFIYLLWPGLLMIVRADDFRGIARAFLGIGILVAFVDIVVPNRRGKLGRAYVKKFHPIDLLTSPLIAYSGAFVCACFASRLLGRADPVFTTLACGVGASVLVWLFRPYRGGTWTLR